MAKNKKSGIVNSDPPKPDILPPPVPEPEDEGIALPGEDLDMEEDLELAEEAPKISEKPPEAAKPGSAPPLFIKVDKYEDVIRNIQELRSYTLSLRDALDALADIEKEMKVGMELAHKSLDRVNAIISMLDSKLLRTEGIRLEGEIRAPKEVEGYIKNVYSQIEKLKSELQAIQ